MVVNYIRICFCGKSYRQVLELIRMANCQKTRDSLPRIHDFCNDLHGLHKLSPRGARFLVLHQSIKSRSYYFCVMDISTALRDCLNQRITKPCRVSQRLEHLRSYPFDWNSNAHSLQYYRRTSCVSRCSGLHCFNIVIYTGHQRS